MPFVFQECRHVKGPLYVMENYPAKCFCFQVPDNETITESCENIYKLIVHLIDNNVAHNLYMIKGKALDGSDKRVVRVLVWVRTSSLGAKQTSAFNLAICEFSGQFPVKSKSKRWNNRQLSVIWIDFDFQMSETLIPWRRMTLLKF